MRAVNHGLTGAAIAVVARQPALAIPLAFASHFLCDAIPHSGTGDLSVRDPKFLKILYLDMALAVVTTLIVAAIWKQYWWSVISCAFLAASPDLMWLYYRYLHTDKTHGVLASFHKKIQWSETFRGYYLEAVWFVVFFGGLVYFGIR
ncbi:hypothetical protein IPO96_03075 [Candidatus Saccharibacteria bacterium]|jgi:hypothetical protein|nr:MAG: hypothetical protein IPO96_03075 [Candidatus Saccharibacteria bacterium]